MMCGDGMEQIKGFEKKHEIGEDVAKTWQDEVQKLTDQHQARRRGAGGQRERHPPGLTESMSSRPQPVATAEAPRAAEEPRTATEGGVPTHVAIIMDGNGRWAASRRLPRIAGHREGARALRRTIEAAIRNRVAWLTIYAFSSEKLAPPRRRGAGPDRSAPPLLAQRGGGVAPNGVRLRFIGDRSRFDPDIQRDLVAAERDTAANTRLNLTVALSYGARAEILAAARQAAEAARAGRLTPRRSTRRPSRASCRPPAFPTPT